MTNGQRKNDKKNQIMIRKTLHRKLKIEQHKLTKNNNNNKGNTGAPNAQFLLNNRHLSLSFISNHVITYERRESGKEDGVATTTS